MIVNVRTIGIKEYVNDTPNYMVPLMARAFLYAKGDTKIALAKALLTFLS